MTAQSDALLADLEKQIAKASATLILEIDSELRKPPSQGGTPIDTGHARASWIPSVGAPSTATGAAAHAAGVAAVLRYKPGQGDLYLANNAPYIGRLNMGSSKQAPVGFIELAMDRALATVQAKYDALNIEIGGRSGAGSFADEAGGFAAAGIADAYSPFGGD